MIDLKAYAGHEVVVQLHPDYQWLITRAKQRPGSDELEVGFALAGPEDHQKPVPAIFVHGVVSKDGRIAPYGMGVEVEINPNAIFAVSRAIPGWKPPRPKPTSHIITP